LADADEQRLLKHWEGLGYYRRARSMHQAAKQIVEQHGGEFPASYEEVLALPGIGRYTAGAVLSISHDARLPILEGNTVRVFSRWVALRSPPRDNGARRLLWRIAEAMLPRQGSGSFNQAAMELGALICTPRNPKCAACPVRRCCRARLDGTQREIPGKVSTTQYEDRVESAFVIREPKRRQAASEGFAGANRASGSSTERGAAPAYLVRPLPEGVRWAGLWDFPRLTDACDSAGHAAAALTGLIGCPAIPGARLKSMKHAVTKYRITLHVHAATLGASDQRPGKPWRFTTLEDMQDLPMSVTGRKIAAMLGEVDL
jgi:A/G-specific adenine glycosylase